MKNNILILFKHIIVYFFVLFVIVSIIFFVINSLIEPQIKKNIAVYSQINSSPWIRYGEFLNNLFSFRGGKIYSKELAATNLSIITLYFMQFKWTILFTVIIFIFSLIIGNLLGIWSAYKFNKAPDFVVNIIVSALATIPLIVLAILALGTSIFLGYPSQFINNGSLTFTSIITPIIITAFGTISLFHARSRKITKETLSSNYYLFGISLGNSKTKLFRQNIIKNLVIAELQVILPFYILLFSTSLIIERIFSIPGQSIFISYVFTKAELNCIMFYFSFNFFALLIARFINEIILNYLNPAQAIEKRIRWIKRKRLDYEWTR